MAIPWGAILQVAGPAIGGLISNRGQASANATNVNLSRELWLFRNVCLILRFDGVWQI
jgi:hypothetical protein